MAVGDPIPAPNIASPEGAYPNYMNPGEMNQLVTMLSGMMGGGQGGFGGGNPMFPQAMPDALGMGMGDPLGMGAMGMFGMGGMGGGLNPYQAADIRLQRGNQMNALRQNMANAHRGIGRFGGQDYSRHVQNIDDEMMALQSKAMESNIQNMFKANEQALAWARFNQQQDQDYWERLLRLYSAIGTFGGARQQEGQVGTAAPAEDTTQAS